MSAPVRQDKVFALVLTHRVLQPLDRLSRRNVVGDAGKPIEQLNLAFRQLLADRDAVGNSDQSPHP